MLIQKEHEIIELRRPCGILEMGHLEQNAQALGRVGEQLATLVVFERTRSLVLELEVVELIERVVVFGLLKLGWRAELDARQVVERRNDCSSAAPDCTGAMRDGQARWPRDDCRRQHEPSSPPPSSTYLPSMPCRR